MYDRQGGNCNARHVLPRYAVCCDVTRGKRLNALTLSLRLAGGRDGVTG